MRSGYGNMSGQTHGYRCQEGHVRSVCNEVEIFSFRNRPTPRKQSPFGQKLSEIEVGQGLERGNVQGESHLQRKNV